MNYILYEHHLAEFPNLFRGNLWMTPRLPTPTENLYWGTSHATSTPRGGGGKNGIFSNASFRCLEITKLTGT